MNTHPAAQMGHFVHEEQERTIRMHERWRRELCAEHQQAMIVAHWANTRNTLTSEEYAMKNVLLATSLDEGNARSRKDHVPYLVISTSYDSAYLLSNVRVLSVSETDTAFLGPFYDAARKAADGQVAA